MGWALDTFIADEESRKNLADVIRPTKIEDNAKGEDERGGGQKCTALPFRNYDYAAGRN